MYKLDKFSWFVGMFEGERRQSQLAVALERIRIYETGRQTDALA